MRNLVGAFFIASLACSVQANPAEQNTIESLRSAIEHLSKTYGDEYPNDSAYLARLEKIADPKSAEYRQLQREALLNHPHVKGYKWLVEVRNQYWGSHGPINTMFQNGDLNKADMGGLKEWGSHGGRFEVISISDSGEVVCSSILGEEKEGIFRDADVRFDGKKILYSMRKNKDDDYHLYEMNLDGSDKRQLTFGSQISDVDPVYMPDGKIVFSSTRDPKFCQCNRHISLNMFSMERDGANIEQISYNNLADFHSSLMPDGRLLYSRWEYVDRHFGPSLGLWTTNPDGTRHALFMGNNAWSPGSMVDARVIPGTDKVVCIYGACHDLPWGALVVVDRSKGLDGNAPVEHIWPQSGRELIEPESDPNYNFNMKYSWHIDKMNHLNARYEDPYPIHDVENGNGGGHFFMVSKALKGPLKSYGNRQKREPVDMAIMLVDVFGNEVEVYNVEDPKVSPYGPIPLSARPTPPTIPNTVDLTKDHGFLYVNDVYVGTGDEMSAVKRGDIKYLRIIEAPPKRFWDSRFLWGIDAAQVTAMNWNLTNNKRIIGDVPVEKDGSAYFQIPSDCYVQIHALDENKQMIQAMRSGTIVRPGETQGCIGCHENRLQAPLATNAQPLAMKRAPSKIDPWLNNENLTESLPFNYLTDVQPIFDKHCISCHDYDKKAGDVINLSGDLSLPFNISYTELMRKSGTHYTGPEDKLVNLVHDGPPGVLPAYSWGSHRSTLVKMLKDGHQNVKLSPAELERIVSWIDVNGVYYGRYESSYPGRNPILALEGNVWGKLSTIMNEWKVRKNMLEFIMKNGPLINFTRPEKSECLKHIADEKRRENALKYITEASELLKKIPRIDQTNISITDSEMDSMNQERWDKTRAENCKSIEAINTNQKYYQFK